jgi:catechol 2,3-dioxygenase-like lactoylglutathione lyase family enzyme
MLCGVHAVLASRDVAADRAFFRDVLALPFVDAGNGRLFFALPPAELGLHEADGADEAAHTELYLMTDDVSALAARLSEQGVPTAPLQDAGWGILTRITLPSGATLGLYEPRHARP